MALEAQINQSLYRPPPFSVPLLPTLKSWAISLTSLWNGNFLIRSSGQQQSIKSLPNPGKLEEHNNDFKIT
ncbi:hypothetical protein C4D60_Mb09t13620 [Musa balbisiana]|uniref:Uncharacterized protein n=1 Tax=Musa balbisiana TaxID=52838 RepID=A0A4S8IGY9_MUSBA|nr:hypothetical protein C4D60_Mb09t13620 [Musa balbisiana]